MTSEENFKPIKFYSTTKKKENILFCHKYVLFYAVLKNHLMF